jgi:hypothetical protein
LQHDKSPLNDLGAISYWRENTSMLVLAGLTREAFALHSANVED